MSILIIIEPWTLVKSLAPICAPIIVARDNVITGIILFRKLPLIICTILPLKAIMATIKYEVAVAICTGKFHKCTSVGTRYYSYWDCFDVRLW